VPTSLSELVIGLYQRYAAQWDAARRGNDWNDRFWIEAFVAALKPGSTVLDLGCGGGEPVARFLVNHGMRVTGIDASHDMIALARARLLDDEWIVADMRHLALGRQFDGILAWDSYFHLSQDAQRAMFAIFKDHAREGTVLLFNTGPQDGEAASGFTFPGEQLYHASLAPAEYRALLDDIGFEVISHTANDARSGGRTAWLCRRRPGMP